ncbi:MAG TPA: hypothetical protein VGA37_04775 [Gemmatimonadales bacterium]
MGRRAGRTVTVLAVGFLGLDAVLLALAGLWSDRPILLVWASAFGAAAVGVFGLWRRYLMHLSELDQARAALRKEIRHISRAIKDAHS